MCRLLALSSRRVPPAALLEKFKALAFEGKTQTLAPDFRGHNDGWGMAAFFGNRLVHQKSALSATDPQGGWDEMIRALSAPALWPGHVILHLRRASPGLEVKAANSHPYHRKQNGRDWFFMANGTVKDFDPDSHQGQTDSEYFMNLVLDHLAGEGSLSEAIAAGKQSLLGRYPKYDSLVGAFLHARGIDAYYDVADKFDRYHTLYRAAADGLSAICSEELNLEGFEWTPIREIGGLTTLASFR